MAQRYSVRELSHESLVNLNHRAGIVSFPLFWTVICSRIPTSWSEGVREFSSKPRLKGTLKPGTPGPLKRKRGNSSPNKPLPLSLYGKSHGGNQDAVFRLGFKICGYGGIGRRAGLRNQCESVGVRVPLSAPTWQGGMLSGTEQMFGGCILKEEPPRWLLSSVG